MQTRHAIRRAFCGTTLALALAMPGIITAEESATTAAPQPPAPLGHNVRLEFIVRAGDKDGESVAIVTAHPWFKSSGALSGKNDELKFSVNGGVSLTDSGDVLLMYELKIEAANKEGEGVFKANASVQLHSGQTLPVARMGDKMLLIRATLLEDKPTDEKPADPAPAQ